MIEYSVDAQRGKRFCNYSKELNWRYIISFFNQREKSCERSSYVRNFSLEKTEYREAGWCKGEGLVSSFYRLVPERIGVLIICNRLVPERIGVLIICNRLVPERIGVLIIFNRWVPVELKDYKL
jgi:hypothetical protein